MHHPIASWFAELRRGGGGARPGADLHPGRSHERGVLALSISVAGLLLFTWPFIATPPLEIASAFVHLLGAWVALLAALFALSRFLERADPGRGRGDA